MAKVTYHKWHSFVDAEGKEHKFVTQLYQVGVYGILDNNPMWQGNFTPQQIVKMEKALEKEKLKGEIKSYTLGTKITVSNESGLWKELP